MLYNKLGKTNLEVSRLGFGTMRLPTTGSNDEIIESEASEMLTYGIENGINIIDTAYPYHSKTLDGSGESETFVGEFLKENNYREDILLSTKSPSWAIEKKEDFDFYLDEQLKKLQTDYIDIYLLHSLTVPDWEKVKGLDVLDFLDDCLTTGKVKHVGFSSHIEVDYLIEIIDEYPKWEVVMTQMNYLDEYYQSGVMGLDYLKETKSKTHSSQYEGFVRLYIRPVIGMIRMNKLTEGDLQAVIDMAYSQNHLSDKTLRDVRGCLTNWLKWCRMRKKTTMHPEGITIPAGAKKPEKKIVQPEDLKKLFFSNMTVWRNKPDEDWYIHAYRFAVLTGLRPGELRGLEDRTDITDLKVVIRRSVNVHNEVTQGKNNNARRTFALEEYALGEIKAQRAMLRAVGIVSPYLFPEPDGGQLNYKNFYRAWKRYCGANNIPPTSLYELRHTYVSINKEMPIGLKKMVVGHSRDMDTEGVYGHQLAGDMEKAASYTHAAFESIIKKQA